MISLTDPFTQIWGYWGLDITPAPGGDSEDYGYIKTREGEYLFGNAIVAMVVCLPGGFVTVAGRVARNQRNTCPNPSAQEPEDRKKPRGKPGAKELLSCFRLKQSVFNTVD